MEIVKHLVKAAIYKLEDAFYDNPIRIDWVRENNFGDVLNPILGSLITDRPILHVNPLYFNGEYVSAIGSICGRANKNTIIWGSGFISADTPVTKPKEIRAVRGPRTAEMYINSGCRVPEIYGDPALLISGYYKPKVPKRYKVGIVPHYVDFRTDFVRKSALNEDINVINLVNPDPLSVIRQMLECEVILSSSLHGLIVPDAYGIKTKWIKLSDNIIGGEFKFKDYYSSIKIENEEPLYIQTVQNINDLISETYAKEINLDLDQLLQACPFHEK